MTIISEALTSDRALVASSLYPRVNHYRLLLIHAPPGLITKSFAT